MRRAILILLVFTALEIYADHRKMSFQIRQMVSEKSAAKKAFSSQENYICAFVKLDSNTPEQLLENYQCRILTHIGQIYIVEIPVSQLDMLTDCDEVIRIETHMGGRIYLDVTAQHANVADAYAGINLPQAFTGQGVLVGISDIGFDLTHPTFYNRDGTKYRIQRFLDQFTMNAESYAQETPLGIEYITQEAILQKQHSGDAEREMHGTHCLGIAAGSGYDTPYRGMAYDADLCIVASKTGDDVNYSANEAAIIKYIFDYADAIQQPCVITYSIGFDYVPNDAILYREALQQMLGPGHILVAAAGNENWNVRYMHKQQGEEVAGTMIGSNTSTITYRIYTQHNFQMTLTSYASRQPTSITIDSNNLPEMPVMLNQNAINITKQDTVYTCQITNDNKEALGLLIEGNDVEAQVVADYYSRFANLPDIDKRLCNAEEGHNIVLPGTLPEVITVGAMCYREYSSIGDYGNIATFSSQGPTIDYRTKPNVVASGVSVISSLNSFYQGQYPIVTSTFNGKEYGWITESGTSMATPAIAGIVALWLEAKPNLTPADVLDVIAHTSQHPVAYIDYPNNTYGHGHIDAYRGLLYILGLDTSIHQLSSNQPQQAHFLLQGRQLSIIYEKDMPQHVEVIVYNMDGKPLLKQNNSNSLDLSTLPHGIYAIQLNTDSQQTSGSTLIRL